MTRSLFSRRTSLLWIALSALLAAALLPVAQAEAFQQSTVTGTVADANTGQPLEGVAVGVVGTGAASEVDRSPSAGSAIRLRR